MILTDVNVLVCAHREDALGHADCRQWLEALINRGLRVLASGSPRTVITPAFRD